MIRTTNRASCFLITNYRVSVHRLLFGIALFIPFFLLSLGKGYAAADLTPTEIAARMQQTYEKTMTLTADFQQTTSMEMTRRAREGSGTVTLMRPGRLRWDYHSPEKQVLICDGTTILLYLAKAEQMIVSSAKEYLQSDLTYSFFTGTGNIQQDFDVFPPDGKKSDNNSTYHIKLVPKTFHQQVESLDVWAEKSTFLATRLKIRDHLGSITDLRFSNIKSGRKLADDIFTFIPPPNTELIEQ